MERNASVPDAVVIDQDDQTQIHLQAVIQSGRRHLDLRLWRLGPAGFTPSRTGLILEGPDLAALRQGIAELLEASDGGTHVARIVWDGEDGRRLRAEVEPFGARHVARFGFWQRVRNTWKPADDGLVLASDLLARLQDVLAQFDPWLSDSSGDKLSQVLAGGARYVPDRWPVPGADWLTVDLDRVAFHPRGVRITCSIVEQGERPAVILRQWKRDESLWLPEAASCTLTAPDLDKLLSALAVLAAKYDQGEPAAQDEIQCLDGSTLWIGFSGNESSVTLRVAQGQRGGDGREAGYQPRLLLPAVYIPRFGRALMQSWLLLVARLSEEEGQELEIEHVPEPEPESEAIEEPEEPSADGQVPDVAADEEPEAPRPPPVPGPITFGADSETPGAVIPGDGEIRVVLEGFLLPRNITLPLKVVAGVVSGLEELDMLHRQHGRVDPILLCDRADCAVYGRVGTRTRPDAVELRVWTGPATSEAIAIEAQHLPELIDGLRQTLAALGLSTLELQSSAQRDEDREYTGQGVIPSSDAFFQAEFESQAPTEPTREKAPAAVAPHSIPLEWIELGYRQVLLSLRRSGESRRLALQWDANTLELPVEHLEEMLTDIRGLYYDALRGRRGHALEVGRHPTVTISVHNQGPQMYVVFEHQIDGERTSLAVPAGEVPAFLNALRSALVSH